MKGELIIQCNIVCLFLQSFHGADLDDWWFSWGSVLSLTRPSLSTNEQENKILKLFNTRLQFALMLS